MPKPEEVQKPALPEFTWQEPEDQPLKRTPLYEVHQALGAKIVPFAGWEMPVWYSSILEEHKAVRTAAGLFDVTRTWVFFKLKDPQRLGFPRCRLR